MGKNRDKASLDAFKRLYTVKGDGIAELKLTRLANSQEANKLFAELRSRKIVTQQKPADITA